MVGASAGAVEALSSILPALPPGFRCPVVVVVHMPPDRSSLLVALFAQKCRVEVKEAEDKEPLQAGTVYFAPPDYHLLVEPDKRLSLSADAPVLFSRPSIDVLFESAADAYGERLLGIVLSGANSDGARGLRMVCESGGSALVQEPSTALCPTMPQAALEACSGAAAATPDEIGAFLVSLGRVREG
ncbi:chemotaxis protein CheB [bacterium]|nr:MAG: chemotaxis protein CheB [bacterium]